MLSVSSLGRQTQSPWESFCVDEGCVEAVDITEDVNDWLSAEERKETLLHYSPYILGGTLAVAFLVAGFFFGYTWVGLGIASVLAGVLVYGAHQQFHQVDTEGSAPLLNFPEELDSDVLSGLPDKAGRSVHPLIG